MSDIEFEPITIFYGNNGSGKSTSLNILARFYNANIQNKSSKGFIFDDIFENMLNVRVINSGVIRKTRSY